MSAHFYAEYENSFFDFKDYTIDAADHEDHSFNGIMFDVSCQPIHAIKELIITSFWVRGALGDISVYCTLPQFSTHFGRNTAPQDWTTVFVGDVAENWTEYFEIKLNVPIILTSGESRGIYIHSRADHDLSIVYDNKRKNISGGDEYLEIWPGMAHTSNQPFSSNGGWGWRSNRQFVGRISYGVRHCCYGAPTHKYFPLSFRKKAIWFMVLHETNSSAFYFPREIVRYILNFCASDWFDYDKPQERKVSLITNIGAILSPGPPLPEKSTHGVSTVSKKKSTACILM